MKRWKSGAWWWARSVGSMLESRSHDRLPIRRGLHVMTASARSARLFALVDVINMYFSCERVFNPELKNKPIVVLSNNDGCAVARSAEVKALGVKMGELWLN